MCLLSSPFAWRRCRSYRKKHKFVNLVRERNWQRWSRPAEMKLSHTGLHCSQRHLRDKTLKNFCQILPQPQLLPQHPHQQAPQLHPLKLRVIFLWFLSSILNICFRERRKERRRSRRWYGWTLRRRWLLSTASSTIEEKGSVPRGITTKLSKSIIYICFLSMIFIY